MTNDLCMLPVAQLVELFRSGVASPVDATLSALARVDALNPALNAFQHLDRKLSLEAARASERRWHDGTPLSDLDGVPITIKDTVETKNMPTRFGSASIGAEGPWLHDAPLSERLRKAGTVLLGKTTSPEFGWKGATDSPLYGVTRNPWNAERTPGGSSGGAAASVAVGMGTLAVGTDAAGSVRLPASFTGIFTLKPTFARIPLYPPSSQGSLSHAGPMTRCVDDAARMMNVMARPDLRDWNNVPFDAEDYRALLGQDIGGMRINVSRTLGFVDESTVAPAIYDALDRAASVFESLGAIITRDEPDLQGHHPGAIMNVHWQSNVALLVAGIPERLHGRMDPGLFRCAAAGSAIDAATVLRAHQDRARLAVIFNEFQSRYDLLLTPTMPCTALPLYHAAAGGGDGVDIGWTPFTLTFNLTKQPAASIPFGFDPDGLPIGLQLVGAVFDDARVLQAAKAFETAIGGFPMPAMGIFNVPSPQ
jgi:aspartyl-tRNA(Asn)/glutamyl-tRNA(Gln) amidotransferase subunit A